MVPYDGFFGALRYQKSPRGRTGNRYNSRVKRYEGGGRGEPFGVTVISDVDLWGIGALEGTVLQHIYISECFLTGGAVCKPIRPYGFRPGHMPRSNAVTSWAAAIGANVAIF